LRHLEFSLAHTFSLAAPLKHPRFAFVQYCMELPFLNPILHKSHALLLCSTGTALIKPNFPQSPHFTSAVHAASPLEITFKETAP
jgi:hypothetical protein